MWIVLQIAIVRKVSVVERKYRSGIAKGQTRKGMLTHL